MTDYTNLIDKVNIPELVKALRSDAGNQYTSDAADAIEALQAEVERLKADVDAAYAH